MRIDAKPNQNGAGMIVLGMQRTTVALPGTTCLLRVLPLVTITIGFSSSGTFTLTGTIPATRTFFLRG